jgi:hypothetical protein
MTTYRARPDRLAGAAAEANAGADTVAVGVIVSLVLDIVEREARKLTQTRLSELIGVNSRAYNRVMNT